ncbi:MAG: serpin family protein [Gemmatimonadetes bacterium]|nr:serpin family protein [Gemmatimonadota bacterium]
MTPRYMAALLFPLLSASACGSESPTDSSPEERQLTVQEQLVANANQRFGVQLLRQLAAASPTSNLMLSPLSVSMALGMTMNGAVGTTYDEMRRVLGFEDLDRSAVNAAYRGLLEQLHVRDPRVAFTIANGIWYRDGFTVKPAFLEEARTSFGAVVRPLDFAAPNAPATINAWVSQATGGRIPELIASIKPEDMMFLINAMYFKAPWSAQFQKGATHAGSFRRDDGGTVQAQLMTQDGTFSWFQNGAVKAVELCYGDSSYAMLLVAPRAGPVAALVGSLTAEQLGSWLGALQPGRVQLTVPKYSFRYGAELKTALRTLGMQAVFTPFVADLSLISATRPDLHVSSVIHKTFIAVDEEGTEAAAATAVTVGVTSLPPALVFDSPFLFVIRERASGTILFAGIVRDPTQG